MVIFHSSVSLPEGNMFHLFVTSWRKDVPIKHLRKRFAYCSIVWPYLDCHPSLGILSSMIWLSSCLQFKLLSGELSLVLPIIPLRRATCILPSYIHIFHMWDAYLPVLQVGADVRVPLCSRPIGAAAASPAVHGCTPAALAGSLPGLKKNGVLRFGQTLVRVPKGLAPPNKTLGFKIKWEKWVYMDDGVGCATSEF